MLQQNLKSLLTETPHDPAKLAVEVVQFDEADRPTKRQILPLPRLLSPLKSNPTK